MKYYFCFHPNNLSLIEVTTNDKKAFSRIKSGFIVGEESLTANTSIFLIERGENFINIYKCVGFSIEEVYSNTVKEIRGYLDELSDSNSESFEAEIESLGFYSTCIPIPSYDEAEYSLDDLAIDITDFIFDKIEKSELGENTSELTLINLRDREVEVPERSRNIEFV